MKALLLLLLVWCQEDPQQVTGWEVWRTDSLAQPFHLEAVVYEPRYRVPMDGPQAFYAVAAFDSDGRVFSQIRGPLHGFCAIAVDVSKTVTTSDETMNTAQSEQLEQMQKDVAEIKRAVIGNKEFREPGLVKRVEVLESWKSWLMLKLAGGVGAIFGVGWFIKYLSGH
jgi:hypothetical protein